MEQRHRKIILDNIGELVAVTHNLDEILDYLKKWEVLNEYMIDHLLTYHALKRRLKEFYMMMMGRGPTAFDNLVSVLRRTENFRAEQLLCDLKVFTEEPSLEPKVIILPAIDELDLGPKTKQVSDIVVKKHPEGKFMDTLVDEKGKRMTYQMRSKPRGHALIINIADTVGYKHRKGSEIDYQKLQDLYRQLGYKVFARENLTDDEIRREVAARKSDPELANVDSFITFIMCHGCQKTKTERSSVELLASNGKPIDTNWLCKEFQCDSLDGKPKQFFFQSCRSVEETRSEGGGTTVRYSRNIETDSELMWKKEKELKREYGDTILGFATIPGNVAMRNEDEGSWFVSSFCEVIAEHACTDDFETLWKKIDVSVAEKNSNQGRQTTELVNRGFNKICYYNPLL